MTGHIVGHLVRRGVQHLTAKQQLINRLEKDAQAYEDGGMEVKPVEMLPMIITGVVAILLIWSIDYTVGQVISSLTMIESPTRTAIVESQPPPPYEDASAEKEPLMAEAKPADVEVMVVEHKPITSSIRGSVMHLHRVGGFRARWRGLRLSILYHILHAFMSNILMAFLGFGVIGEALVYVFVSLGLARVHMAWTHSMIAYPSQMSWLRRLPARRECKGLLLPALVYALAQQATLVLPIGVGFALGVIGPYHSEQMGGMDHHCPKQVLIMGLRFLAIPFTYVLVGLAILLPASVTLTRIEASLLPEGEETIVPFDKAAMIGNVDLSVRGGHRALFLQAWRSFDRSSRLRIIKLYAKMVLAQFTIAIMALHLVVAEIFVMGPERLGTFFKSAAAQMKLMAIEAHDKQN